jgi:hypothetical protein
MLSQGNVPLLRNQCLNQLVFICKGLPEKEIRCDVSSAGKGLAFLIAVLEVTSINQKVTALTQGMMEKMMITICKSAILLWGQGVQDRGILINEALEKLEAFAGDVFLPTRFVVGTVPTADSINQGILLTVHSRTAACC